MFKQIILPILAVIAFIVIVGIFSQKTSFPGLAGLSVAQLTSPTEKSLVIGSNSIQVQIADTAEKRTRGLSGKSSLAEDSGMLFVFGTAGNAENVSPTFWMKDMLIPVDIIWINDGEIVRIDKKVPAPSPNTPDNQLKTYSAGQAIDYVLEVNAGFADKNDIKVGDAVDLSGI